MKQLNSVIGMDINYDPDNGPAGAVLVIQYNWEENIRNNEKSWVYYKKLNEKNIHGNTGDGTFNMISGTNRLITICHVPTDFRTKFISPFRTFENVHTKSILSLDVNRGGLGLSVSIDNKLNVWQTDDGTLRRQLEGHLFDVYRCCLFPSGIVALSSGADMQIKIWDVATGVCPVTLKGHTAAVNDFCIIEKGRNIISVSKDGSAKLWHCADSKCIGTLLKTEVEINCCEIADVENIIHLNNDNIMTDEREFGTLNKLVAFGCDDGKVYLVAVASKEIISAHFLSSSVTSICWSPALVLIIGLEDGSIMTLDAMAPSQLPQLLCHDSASAVLCVTLLNEGILIGRRDGLCQYYKSGKSSIQLTGPNCDPVYAISTDPEYIYTACRDAIIRKYKISDLGL